MRTIKRIFGKSKNNKGLQCPFKSITCQEGYCNECQIYLDWEKETAKNLLNQYRKPIQEVHTNDLVS